MKATLIAFAFLISPAMAQTVAYKSPPTPLEVCTHDSRDMAAQLTALQDINAQLTARVKVLETVKPVEVTRKKVQVCKRWRKHKCTWRVWR